MQLGVAAELPGVGDTLSDAQVTAFARLAIEGIEKEYPNKPSNVMVGAESVLSPQAMHPVFYGCFDWHSSVHGHWMLVRLLKLYPESSVAGEIRRLLNRQFTAAKLAKEAAYFEPKENRSFERMYGWAWALRLAAELRTWDDPQAREWAAHLAPLENRIVELARGYLPRLSYPIRTGVHPDTAFALAQVLDYAVAVGDKSLQRAVVQRCRDYYLRDRDYPTTYEPSGEDFFSGGLNEADLMRRVLGVDEFSAWLDRFLPGLRDGGLGNLLSPVEVSDVTDPRIVHLAGLNLSRGWTLHGVASALKPDDPRRKVLQNSVSAHTEAGLGYVFSGHYEIALVLTRFVVGENDHVAGGKSRYDLFNGIEHMSLTSRNATAARAVEAWDLNGAGES